MSIILSNCMDLHYAIFSLTLLLFSLDVLCQLSPNITLGSSLTANNVNNSWTSPSGEFVFGFIQPESERGYLLVIWFNKIPEKTLIWSANRNQLAPEGSRLQLLQNGRLVLNDPSGHNIWDANIEGVGVAYGAMLDTGNFVLATNTSLTLWQTFDTPTDTLLPSQMLTADQYIVSNLRKTNYSSGRFQLRMQSNGNLLLYTTHYPLPGVNSPYWETKSSGNDFHFVFNQTGVFSVVAKNGSLINSVFPNIVPLNQYYQRLTLDYDGVLRQYVYPKSSNSTGGRPMAWSIFKSLPDNICLSIVQEIGGGVCGYNSLCLLDSDQKLESQCPAGYSFIDPNDSMTGCKADFVPQSCDNKVNEAGPFGFNDMSHANWHLSDYELFPVRDRGLVQTDLS